MQIDFLPLEKRLWEDGIAQIGFSDLHGLLPERYAHLPYGVTLVFRLCSGVLDEVKTRFEPTFTYFQHYRAVNAALDNAARLSARLENSLRRRICYESIYPYRAFADAAGR